MHTRLAIISALTSFMILGCSKDESSSSSVTTEEELSIDIDQSARQEAIRLYTDYYLASSATSADLEWNGNIDNCSEGSLPSSATTKIFQRLNYYRLASGLDEITIENETNSLKSSKAALMMHANNSLDHFPPESWSCFSDDGKQAAANALLTSVAGPAAIDSYIRDHGTENGPVGHRRWLLWPRLQEIGIGNTNRYNALWVIGNAGTRPTDPEFVAWPPENYVPKQVVFPRWSFSLHRADFGNSKVEMKYKNGNSIKLKIEELSNAYGDPTIVWVPELNLNTIDKDTLIEVSINSVDIDGTSADYRYEVIVINP